jgi:hypothetical protein
MNWLTFAFGFIVAAALAFGLHSLDIWRIDAAQKDALAAQAATINSQCNADKKLVEGVSHDYQNRLSAADVELNRLRAATAVCVPVASTSPGCDGAAGRARPSRPNGITAQALLDYAADYKKEHEQLIACQNFVNKVWNINNQ